MAYIFFIIYLVLNILSPHRWSGDPAISLDPIIALLALVFSFTGANRPTAVVGYGAQVTMVCLFFMWFMISALVAGTETPAFEYTYKGFLLYIIASLAIQQVAHLNKVLVAIAIIGTIIALNGILTIDFGSGFVPLELSWGYRLNWIQGYDDSNTTAVLLNMSACIILVILLASKSYLYKALSLISLGILVYGINLTESRAATLGLAGLTFTVLAMRFSTTKAIIYSSPLVLVGIVFASSRMLDLNADDSSAQNRMIFWARGFELLWESPIVGVGFQEFNKIIGKQAHNTIVQIFAETGLPGYLLWLAMFYIGVKALLSVWKKAKSSEELADLRAPIQMLYGASLALFIGAWFVTIYNDLIYIWLGICMSVYRIAYARDKSIGITVDGKDYFLVAVFSFVGLLLIRLFVQLFI